MQVSRASICTGISGAEDQVRASISEVLVAANGCFVDGIESQGRQDATHSLVKEDA